MRCGGLILIVLVLVALVCEAGNHQSGTSRTKERRGHRQRDCSNWSSQSTRPIRIPYGTSSLALDADLTLERAHPADHFGQPRYYRRSKTAPLPNVHGRDTTDDDVVIQIIVGYRLSPRPSRDRRSSHESAHPDCPPN